MLFKNKLQNAMTLVPFNILQLRLHFPQQHQQQLHTSDNDEWLSDYLSVGSNLIFVQMRPVVSLMRLIDKEKPALSVTWRNQIWWPCILKVACGVFEQQYHYGALFSQRVPVLLVSFSTCRPIFMCTFMQAWMQHTFLQMPSHFSADKTLVALKC